ncbi:MAG: Phage tail protein, partial [Capsulimonas sp.]|nr:Phage tail protein [Capsulimonas sp.]
EDTNDGMLYGVVSTITITLRAPDPAWFDTANTTPTLSGAGGTIVNAGTAPAKPRWTVTVGTGGTGTITLTNSTTGETATLSGTFVTGDVIVIDRSAYNVTLNGATNFGLLGGRIPSLDPGSNTITASASTISIASLACVYIARRY